MSNDLESLTSNGNAFQSFGAAQVNDPSPSVALDINAGCLKRWLDTVFQGEYLPSLSINYVAINKVLEKLPPQLY